MWLCIDLHWTRGGGSRWWGMDSLPSVLSCRIVAHMRLPASLLKPSCCGTSGRYVGSAATMVIITVSCITYSYLLFISSLASESASFNLICCATLGFIAAGVYGSWLATFIVGPGRTTDLPSALLLPGDDVPEKHVTSDSRSGGDAKDSSSPKDNGHAYQLRPTARRTRSAKLSAASRVERASIESAFQQQTSSSSSSSSSTVASNKGKAGDKMTITSVADSGCVPPAIVGPENKHDNAQKCDDELVMCDICQLIKPAGARHCRVCGTCALRRDHHCPWIGICVGQYNISLYKAFLLFASIGSFLPMIISLSLAYTKSNGFENLALVRNGLFGWYILYFVGHFESLASAQAAWRLLYQECVSAMGGVDILDLLILASQCMLSSAVVLGVGFLVIIHIFRIPLHRYMGHLFKLCVCRESDNLD